jgi:hypothetical protein
MRGQVAAFGGLTLPVPPVALCGAKRWLGDPVSTMQTVRRSRAMYMAADRPAKLPR